MRGKIILFCLFIFFSFSLGAQKIRIGLFYNHLVTSFTLHCIKGEFTFLSGGDTLVNLIPGEIYYMRLHDGMINLRGADKDFGSFPDLVIREAVFKSECRIKPVEPSLDPESYSGNFRINIEHEIIQIINETEMDNYLAGVVEAEVGPVEEDELYKAQSIICRTYALKNWMRHSEEGFNLCDEVHCQVYNGISDENPAIMHAILSTHNLVLTDIYSRLIDPVYHSNSGGETQRAGDIWPEDHDYLQAIIDPFSEGRRNASWLKTISLEEWKDYLKNKGFKPDKKAIGTTPLITQIHRQKYFVLGKDSLSLSMIRKDFDLKSTFFDMEEKGDSILIKGRGYGHGIGLSQEGAMQMANEGYSYSDILQFYFYQIKVINIDDLPVSQVPLELR